MLASGHQSKLNAGNARNGWRDHERLALPRASWVSCMISGNSKAFVFTRQWPPSRVWQREAEVPSALTDLKTLPDEACWKPYQLPSQIKLRVRNTAGGMSEPCLRISIQGVEVFERLFKRTAFGKDRKNSDVEVCFILCLLWTVHLVRSLLINPISSCWD